MPRISRPSPAMAVALVALFVALGGTGYAVTKLPKNSVGNEQLKKGAVDTLKVEDYSLRKRDFAPGQVPAGAQGPVGPVGPPGPKGTTNTVVRMNSNPVQARSGSPLTQVQCEPGEHALGGGGSADGGKLTASAPYNGGFSPTPAGEAATGWFAASYNDTANDGALAVYVICAAP